MTKGIQIVERGRPKKNSRGDLVAVITDLFWSHGYQPLSINEIAKELGLTRSSLYNSFKTKEALFLECMEYYLVKSPTSRFKTYVSGEPVGPLLYSVFNEICEKRSKDVNRRGCLATNTFNELASSKTDLGKKLLANNAKRKAVMTKMIQCAIEQNEIAASSDPKVFTNMIISFMNGLNIHAKTNVSMDELQKMSFTFLQTIGFKH